MRAFGKNPRRVETTNTPQKPPNQRCLVPVMTDRKVDKAAERKRENNADISIYMDRSGYKGGTGAAVVLYRRFREIKVMREYLGMIEEHTVFEGEYMGHMLEMELLR